MSDYPQLYVADTSGGTPREVADAAPLPDQILIAWSADGGRVLYTADSGECNGGRRYEGGGFGSCPPGYLYMTNADGSGTPLRLYEEPTSAIIGWDE